MALKIKPEKAGGTL